MIPKLQGLPPEQAHLCLRIEKRFGAELPSLANSHLLLAISGGADSAALALIFRILASRLNLRLCAIHLNHAIRPAADVDARFVANFCQQLDMPCEIVKINVPAKAMHEGVGLEEAGRNARQEAFLSHLNKIGADYILTAHHAGDLAEDILLKLLRGAAWPALGGMPWQRGKFLRPFLHEDPQALREFVTACGFDWREDESNNNLAFKRNRIRHLLMPMLHCENPSMRDTCIKMHDQAGIDHNYWQTEIAKALQKHPWLFANDGNEASLVLEKPLLQAMHPALRLRLFNYALQWLRQKLELPGQNSYETLTGIEESYQRGVGAKKIECAGGIQATWQKGQIIFSYSKNGNAGGKPT